MLSSLQRGLQALRSPRVGLLLYAVLVLLPAMVFGALLWDQLRGDHLRTLQEAPREVRDAASRMGGETKRRLKRLMDSEEGRPFFQFADAVWVSQEDGVGADVASTLRTQPPPPGIQGWFQFDTAEAFEADLQLYYGSGNPAQTVPTGELKEWLQTHAVDYSTSRYPPHKSLERYVEEVGFLLPSQQMIEWDLASIVFFTHQGARVGCTIEDLRRFMRDLKPTTHKVLQRIEWHLLPGPDGKPTILALRDVMIPRFEPSDLSGSPESPESETPVGLGALFTNQHWVQGFWIDSEWLFKRMPREVAQTVLADRQNLLFSPPSPLEAKAWVQGQLDLLEGIDFARSELSQDLGKLVVAVNTEQISERYRTQSLWFAGLGGIMLVSCVLGLRLLLVRIRLSAENARRSENFVAAVTHELRTPISVVKLYGEMLRDDWVQDPEKRQAYAERIVDESNRLSLLVDRVLDKRRLLGKLSPLSPGDLNEEIRNQAELLGFLDAPDLRFDLFEDLPRTQFTTEGVHTVLSNLVENARKYAPVSDDRPEPILIRTRPGKRSKVWFEVCDRGKGIPIHEREKVLEAFYRIGNEATRDQPGTGLGLNLCAQSMRAQRGTIRIIGRPGGGTVFRAVFRRA